MDSNSDTESPFEPVEMLETQTSPQKLSLDLQRIKSKDEKASTEGRLYRKQYLIRYLADKFLGLAAAVNNDRYEEAQDLIEDLKRERVLKPEET